MKVRPDTFSMHLYHTNIPSSVNCAGPAGAGSAQEEHTCDQEDRIKPQITNDYSAVGATVTEHMPALNCLAAFWWHFPARFASYHESIDKSSPQRLQSSVYCHASAILWVMQRPAQSATAIRNPEMKGTQFSFVGTTGKTLSRATMMLSS